MQAPVAFDYSRITVNGQLYDTEAAATAAAIQLAKDGTPATFSTKIDYKAYDQAKATFSLFLSAVRATERELVTLKEISAQTDRAHLAPIRQQFRAVKAGALVQGQLEKLERRRTNSCYAMRWTGDITAMERALQLQPIITRITMLKQILASWPSFDIFGKAILDTTSAPMKAHTAAATACEEQRVQEYTHAAVTTTELIFDTEGRIVGAKHKEPPVFIEQPDWDRAIKSEDVMKEVNRILYTVPVSIGDSRTLAAVKRKRHPDRLDAQISQHGPLSYELLAAAGFDISSEA